MFGIKKGRDWEFRTTLAEFLSRNLSLQTTIQHLENQVRTHDRETERIRAYLDCQRAMTNHQVFRQQGLSLENIISNFSTAVIGNQVIQQMERKDHEDKMAVLWKRNAELEELLKAREVTK